jgi:hypothetical protein
MASPFRETIDFFETIGLFDVVLPFLLVFTVVFALLERTKVFGVEKVEGKEYTKKNLNAIASFVIALFVVGSSELVEIITEVSSNFVVLLFGIVLFLLLVGSFHKEEDHGFFLQGGYRTGFMVLVFIVLVIIFLDALNLIDNTFDFLSGTNRGELVGSIILLILIVAFIIYVTQERHPPAAKKS